MAGVASGDSQVRRQQKCAVKSEKLSNTLSLVTGNRSGCLAVVLLGTQAASKGLNVFIVVVWLPRIMV